MTEAVDMSRFIEARSDQMNADDLLDAPRTITITRVSATPDSAEQPVTVHFEGDNGKPFKPCKTVRRIMVGVWGADASKYVGRSMTLYRDPTVSFGGMQVGGIRVSHMSHIDGEKTVALMVTRGRKAPFKVKPLAQKVQPAPDVSVALQAIEDAAEHGLEALKAAWSQKWMAPHREALQADLERLKKAAAAKGAPAVDQPDAFGLDPIAGPQDEPNPNTNDADPASTKADEIIAAVKAVDNVAAAQRLLAENSAHYQAFPAFLQRKVDMEAGNHIAELGAKEDAASDA
jgi:hypothetical protein